MLYLKSKPNLEDIEKGIRGNLLPIPLLMKWIYGILRLDVQKKEFEIRNITCSYINAEKGIDLADGWVPETDFFLWDDEKIVGFLFRVRHYLTLHLQTEEAI